MIRKTVLTLAFAMFVTWAIFELPGCAPPDGGQSIEEPEAIVAPVVEDDMFIGVEQVVTRNERGECYKVVWDAQLNWYVHKRVDCPSSQSIRRRGPHTGARGGIFDNGGNKITADSTR